MTLIVIDKYYLINKSDTSYKYSRTEGKCCLMFIPAVSEFNFLFVIPSLFYHLPPQCLQILRRSLVIYFYLENFVDTKPLGMLGFVSVTISIVNISIFHSATNKNNQETTLILTLTPVTSLLALPHIG